MVTAAAVAFGLHVNMPTGISGGLANNPGWQTTFMLIDVIAHTICVAGLFIVLCEFRTSRQLKHPGYLLFVALGCYSAWTIATQWYWGSRIHDALGHKDGEYNSRIFAQWTYWIAVGTIVLGAISIFGVLKYSWRWRICFLSLAGSAFLGAMVGFMQCRWLSVADRRYESIDQLIFVSNISGMALLGSALVLFGCALIDIFSKQKADWIHWWSIVGCCFLLYLPNLVRMIAARYVVL